MPKSKSHLIPEVIDETSQIGKAGTVYTVCYLWYHSNNCIPTYQHRWDTDRSLPIFYVNVYVSVLSPCHFLNWVSKDRYLHHTDYSSHAMSLKINLMMIHKSLVCRWGVFIPSTDILFPLYGISSRDRLPFVPPSLNGLSTVKLEINCIRILESLEPNLHIFAVLFKSRPWNQRKLYNETRKSSKSLS